MVKMRHYIIMSLSSIALLMACSKEIVCPKLQKFDDKVFYAETPSSDNSKVFIDNDRSILWNANDMISVFRSVVNEKYQFGGITGEIVNEFHKADGSLCGDPFHRNYAIFPYSSLNSCKLEGEFSILLPDVQEYEYNGFGNGANLMAAVTDNYCDDVFHFKNVCSYLRLQIYGGDVIRKIVFRGNNGEKIAGNAFLTCEHNSTPILKMSDDATTDIILDCGEDGIPTGKTADNCTVFWLVIPPVLFETGFSVELQSIYGAKQIIKTTKEKRFTPNFIKTMQAVCSNMDDCCEMLDFRLSDGKEEFTAFRIKDGYIDIQVPNGLDLSSLTAVFNTNGVSVTVDEIVQTSGNNSHDFSDFVHPIQYVVASHSGHTNNYLVRLFDLPIAFLETPGNIKITSKEQWLENASISIRECNGTETVYESISVKGRGNITWGFPKKPYNIKFREKEKVLGMKKSKHWALMAAWRDRTLARDEIVSRLARQFPSLGWQPDGRFVELFVNNNHQGVYRFSERIKVEKNRVNITELNPSDESPDLISGGYLLEYDRYEDEPIYFKTQKYNQIVKVKSPDEDKITQSQLNYINEYINDLELSLYDSQRFAAHEYLDYLDIESFIDWYLVYEVLANTDATHNSRYRIKDRNGKLKCGPTWDAELIYMSSVGYSSWIAKGEPYIKRMFADPLFVQRLKEKWEEFKTAVRYSSTLNSGLFPEELDDIACQLCHAQERNFKIYPITNNVIGDSYMTYEEAVLNMKTFYYNRMEWLDKKIKELK